MARILLCGQRSFAANGLVDLLEKAGHEVLCFSRGELAQTGSVVSGPLLELASNPHLQGHFDTLINFIFLSNESLEKNAAYMEALLEFAKTHSVQHLIQISSCSVYANEAREIDEQALRQLDLNDKGPYAAVKVTQELVLEQKRWQELKLSFVRPGLIIGAGMNGFMGGIGLRLPSNSILGLGSARSHLPLISREALHRSLLELVKTPPVVQTEVLLLADTLSPTRKEYLQLCSAVLGAGKAVYFLPVCFWLFAAYFADLLLWCFGKRIGVVGKVRSVCRFQRFSSASSEKRVGFSFSEKWGEKLREAFPDQERNFSVPQLSASAGLSVTEVCYLGFGRIVRQRHLPALKYLRFKGRIRAIDLQAFRDKESGVEVQALIDANPAAGDALCVVATPGPVHIEALELLAQHQGPLIIEKPLCYSQEDFSRFADFARQRSAPVLCCHNRRMQPNVWRMFDYLERFNSGKLHHVSLFFQSPTVRIDPVLWLRRERESRTLLMDYGIHGLDLACIFARGRARLTSCRFEQNPQGETSLIEGGAEFDNHTVSFLLRQGLIPRRNQLCFCFQNYTVLLGFSPDVFLPMMADDNFGTGLIQAKEALFFTVKKAWGYLRGRGTDLSHVRVYQALQQVDGNPLKIAALAPSYDLVFQIAEQVYERKG